MLAIGAIPHSDSANALPPLPPPIPPTTIFNPPTTLGTAPPPPDYLVNVLLLNQDTSRERHRSVPWPRTATGCSNRSSPNGATTAAAAAGPIGTIYDPIPAGTSSLISGNHFAFPADAMPSGALMTLRVREAGVPGSLCRTRPVSPLPPTGQYLHLLVAPPVATNAAAERDGRRIHGQSFRTRRPESR